ncbi:hypothetical protein HUW46_06084 [Amycolatopsis sp. CA-230715]|nr:hypothetical protein HUW46_06084 [Amycolatopsis sp. CA-230715]
MFGGYGAVGKVVSGTLGEHEVVVAGRDAAKATIAVDVADPAAVRRAIDGADVVVMCVERANAEVARACLERGVHYVDVSASEGVHDSIIRLDEVAVANGATAVLGVGLAPGLTNLLARRCADRLETPAALDIAVLLGLGEHHGDDAVRWTVAHLADRATARRKRVHLPGFGARTAFSFAFSDQRSLARTLGVAATTRMCFDSRAATRALFALRSAGVFAAIRRLRLERALIAAFSAVHFGSDRFAVRVDVAGAGGEQVSATATGRAQSRATGIVAAHVVRLLGEGSPPGVRQIDELPGSSKVVTALPAAGILVDEDSTVHRATR